MSKTRRRPAREEIRSCFKTPQPARYDVMNRFKMLMYSRVNGAFSPIYVLSRTHLMNFKTTSKERLKKTLGLKKGRVSLELALNVGMITPCANLGVSSIGDAAKSNLFKKLVKFEISDVVAS
jgi:hypothetical protein